jgi:hypothetical protein
MSSKIIICPTCEHNFEGKFCPNCGEKTIKKNYSLKEFLSNALEGFLSFDSKFLRTLKYLVFNPGYLTNQFLEGKRINYMKPFQLFLILNLIMFFTFSFFSNNVFTTTLNNQANFMPYSSIVKFAVHNEHKLQNMTEKEYEDKFNSRLEGYSKSLTIIFIPLFALVLKLLYRKRFYAEHLVFSTHYVGFTLLFFGVFYLSLLVVISLSLGDQFQNSIFNTDTFSVPLIFIVFSVYQYFSLRMVYEKSKIRALIKSASLFIGWFVVLTIYRFILFVLVYGSLKLS